MLLHHQPPPIVNADPFIGIHNEIVVPIILSSNQMVKSIVENTTNSAPVIGRISDIVSKLMKQQKQMSLILKKIYVDIEDLGTVRKTTKFCFELIDILKQEMVTHSAFVANFYDKMQAYELMRTQHEKKLVAELCSTIDGILMPETPQETGIIESFETYRDVIRDSISEPNIGKNFNVGKLCKNH